MRSTSCRFSVSTAIVAGAPILLTLLAAPALADTKSDDSLATSVSPVTPASPAPTSSKAAPKEPLRSSQPEGVLKREEKRFAAQLMPVGLLGLRAAAGLTGGLYFGGRLYSEIYVEGGENKTTESGTFKIWSGEAEESRTTKTETRYQEGRSGVRLLYFVGGSFYASVGLGVDVYRNIQDIQYSNPKKEGTATANYGQLDSELGVGNRWIVGPVSFGATWFTLQQSLVKLYGSTTSSGVRTKDVNELKADLDDNAKSVGYHFVKVYVGVAL